MLMWWAIISAILFVGGTLAYWLVSAPLKELPNFHELMAAQAAAKKAQQAKAN